MKRILPMLFCVIFVLAEVAYFIMLPHAYVIFSNTAVWASAYISNLYFIVYSLDYFNANTQFYPLLHTWTLAIEEQYYIFWPAIIWGLSRFINHKNLQLVVIGVLFFCSLSFAIYCASHVPSSGYFTIFSRMYEFMVGSILALLIGSEHLFYHMKENRLKIILANFVSFLGLSLIILSSIFLNDSLKIPGAWALLPTIGATLFIYAGHISTKVFLNNLLSRRVFVGIGLISYSLYLWHWPIIAFWSYVNSNTAELSVKYGIVLIGLTFVLSFISYFLIEKPLRKLKLGFKATLFLFQIVPMIAILMIAILVNHYNGIPQRIISPQTRSETLFLDDSASKCFDGTNSKYEPNNCVFGAKLKTAPRVLLIGDSHAANYYGFWNEVARKYNFNFKFLAVGTCQPLIVLDKNIVPKTNNTGRRCAKQASWFTANYSDYDVIILGGAWNSYTDGRVLAKNADYLKQQQQTFKYLNDHGKKVIIMGDISRVTPSDFLNNQILVAQNFPLVHRLRPAIRLSDESENLTIKNLSKGLDNIYYFSVYANLINEISGYPYINKFLLYNDADHLNQHGSELLGKAYMDESSSKVIVEKLINWKVINGEQ